ncbi:MAG TPA: thiamine-phosphate kinase [Gemmatimonadales bacterium]|nr:thiamine-phosphate kinase [Gemmatimonadales bacterium]
MPHVALGPGREFDRVRAVQAALGPAAAGLGDDCAVLPPAALAGAALVVSTDASVEDVHFRRGWLTLEEVGWRAAAAALSDLAAEGAEPLGLVAAVAVPAGAEDAALTELMRGVGAAAAAVGTRVLGGDLTAGPVWAVAVTVFGRAERPVTRAGARPGDGLWVTGALGGARAALEALEAGTAPAPAARERFARPAPRIAAGRWLAAHGATAMLDLSDGLGGDVRHLAAASGVRLAVALEQAPVAADAVAPARAADVPVQRWVAEGGEDYELLVTLPPTFGAAEARAFEAATGLALTRIGAVERGAGVDVRLAGRPLALRGFDHFG